jgi:hypothetical protein
MAAAFAQPEANGCDGVSPERGTAFLAPFPAAAHVGAWTEHDVFAPQTDQFGDAQAGLQGQQE